MQHRFEVEQTVRHRTWSSHRCAKSGGPPSAPVALRTLQGEAKPCRGWWAPTACCMQHPASLRSSGWIPESPAADIYPKVLRINRYAKGKGVAPHLTHTRLAGRSGELRELPLRAYARACWRRTRILVAQGLGERPVLVGTDSASRTAAAAAGPSVCSAVRPIDELGRERRRHSCTQQPGLLR